MAAVEDSVPTSSLEGEDSDNEDEDDYAEGGGAAGVAAHSNVLRLPSPPTASSLPSPAAPRPIPPANLRLTLAHFRPRRGQHMENKLLVGVFLGRGGWSSIMYNVIDWR